MIPPPLALADTTPPTITASFSPLLNAAGWGKEDVTVTFTCSDADSGIAVCPLPVFVTTEGEGQIIVGTATDLAGNSTSTSVTLHIDKTPPQVTAAVTPLPNAAGCNNADTTVTFTAQDSLSGVGNVTLPVTVSIEGTPLITGQATDQAGNIGLASTIVHLDKTPPVVALFSPLAGFSTTVPVVNISGTITDNQPITSLIIGGQPTDLVGNRFNKAFSFLKGAHTLTVSATDIADNIGTAIVSGQVNLPPTLALTDPFNLSVVAESTVTVSGTIDDPNATVVVNGVTTSNTAGRFSAAVLLQEGANTISAVATDRDGLVMTASLLVIRDTVPPKAVIQFPSQRFKTVEEKITLTGLLRDLGDEGSGNNVTVVVNGHVAHVAERAFKAVDIPLQMGGNLLTVTATDATGNTDTATVEVTRGSILGSLIRIVSGDDQSGPIGSLLPQPLVVEVTDNIGQKLVGKQVIFKVVENNGVVNEAGFSIATTTDLFGRAQVNLRLGTRSGAGRNRVEASVVGVVDTVSFVATGTVGGASAVYLDGGNSQTGVVGQPLPVPFVAVVTDTGHNRVFGVPVTFTVREGGGNLNGTSSQTVHTDKEGRTGCGRADVGASGGD